MNRLTLAVAVLLSFTVPLAAQNSPSTAPAGSAQLQICLAATRDYSPVYPTDHILPAKEVAAVFKLADSDKFDSVTSEWIAVDVGDAAPPNTSIAKGELPLKGQRGGALRLTGLQKNMPVGQYRLDVTTPDGKAWKSAEFRVVQPQPAAKLSKPVEMMPLTPGTRWTYNFVQQAAGGARINTEDLKLDPDGKLRATVTMTVADADKEKGAHVQMRRNDRLVFEEWFKLTDKGLSSIQRKQGEDVTVLDPPQILWAWPLRPSNWNYTPKDKSYKQTAKMWGPLPVKTPDGEKPGWIVFIEQPAGLSTISAERHWVPGMGLSREIIITTLNQEIISRQEMTLTELKQP